jgi:DNA-binding response OmpR family regulator
MTERISILIIDDDRIIRMILQSTLSAKGFDVHIAEDGASGLKIAQEEDIDVILLDWMMPEIDGMQVLRKLKQNKKTEHIPVFMLTGKEDRRDIDRAVSSGIDDYIIKPINTSQIHTMIRERLKKIRDAGNGRKISYLKRMFSKNF